MPQAQEKFELKYIQSRSDIRDYVMLPRELKFWEIVILSIPCIFAAFIIGYYFPNFGGWVENHTKGIFAKLLLLVILFLLVFLVQALYIYAVNLWKIYRFKPNEFETKITGDENAFEFESGDEKYASSWQNSELFLFKDYVVIYPIKEHKEIIIPSRAFKDEAMRRAFIKMAYDAGRDEEDDFSNE